MQAPCSGVAERLQTTGSVQLNGQYQAVTVNAMRAKWILLGLAVAVLALLVWAWLDGGRRPVREIVIPLAVPDSAR